MDVSWVRTRTRKGNIKGCSNAVPTTRRIDLAVLWLYNKKLDATPPANFHSTSEDFVQGRVKHTNCIGRELKGKMFTQVGYISLDSVNPTNPETCCFLALGIWILSSVSMEKNSPLFSAESEESNFNYWLRKIVEDLTCAKETEGILAGYGVL